MPSQEGNKTGSRNPTLGLQQKQYTTNEDGYVEERREEEEDSFDESEDEDDDLSDEENMSPGTNDELELDLDEAGAEEPYNPYAEFAKILQQI